MVALSPKSQLKVMFATTIFSATQRRFLMYVDDRYVARNKLRKIRDLALQVFEAG